MAKAAVPVLGNRKWVLDPVEKLGRMWALALASDASQSDI